MDSLDDIILDLEKKLKHAYSILGSSSPNQYALQEDIDMLRNAIERVKLKKGNKRNG